MADPAKPGTPQPNTDGGTSSTAADLAGPSNTDLPSSPTDPTPPPPQAPDSPTPPPVPNAVTYDPIEGGPRPFNVATNPPPPDSVAGGAPWSSVARAAATEAPWPTPRDPEWATSRPPFDTEGPDTAPATDQAISHDLVRGVLAILSLYHAYHSQTMRAGLEQRIEDLGLDRGETLDALATTPRPGS
jgi:hypothetical protein